MKCKNCGTKVSDTAKICPNCGAMIDEDEGYILLTSEEMEFEDYYSSDRKKKKGHSGFKWFVSILLTLAIVGGGAYYYFTNIYEKVDPRPEVTFTGGCGIINDDEEIVYVTVNNPNIEYIHGVNLYSYDRDANPDGDAPITTEYQYTKSINNSFRAIFFDLNSLNNIRDRDCTFEMKFSFSGSSEVYTYTAKVHVDKEVKADVSDIIFDHSTEEETADDAESTTKAETTTEKETTTKAKASEIDFIYDGYWFTKPLKDGNKLTIVAYSFKSDNTFTATKYYKDGDKDWKITADSGKLEVSDYSVTAGSKEFLIDSKSKKITDTDGSELAARKYNSKENAEDFFGI